METFRFTVHLANVTEVSDDAADAFFDAGCDDGTFGACGGQAFVEFDREASSLEEAIRSAVENVEQAGFQVREVTSSEFETIARFNRDLATQ